MKENTINFSRNDDPTLVVDADGKMAKKLSKIYSNISLNLGFCYEQLTQGTLTKGMADTHLSLTEHYVIDFLKEMGYDGILKKESEKRHAEIRSLNEQNRDLRKQLGEKVTNEDFRERAKNISLSIRRWWNIYGFGHVSEICFTEYGYVKVNLSGMLFEAHYDKDGDQSVEYKVKYLKELGFEFDKDEEGLLVSDENFETLTKLIIDKYPSARFGDIVIYPYSKKRSYKSFEFLITNLDDITNSD